jgi:hypothetical protein
MLTEADKISTARGKPRRATGSRPAASLTAARPHPQPPQTAVLFTCIMSIPLRRIVSILAVNLLIALGGGVALELLFGNWIRADNLNRLNILRNRRLTYNAAPLYSESDQTIRYTRDSYGLRGAYDTPSSIDILTLGGSTTDQRFITDGKTWQDVLQRRFAESGRRVIVANAGVDGHSSIGHIKSLDWWLPHIPGLKPKFILFYIGLNDFYKTNTAEGDVLSFAERPTILNALREKSALYHVFRTLYGIYLSKVKFAIDHRSIEFGGIQWTRQPLLTSYDDLMQKPLKEYEARLEILIEKTKAFGATPVFVTQPSWRYRLDAGGVEGIASKSTYRGVEINGVDFFHMMKRLDDLTMRTCRRHSCICLDLSSSVEWKDEDFYDYAHMTPKGAEKLGTHLHLMLKNRI